MVTVRFTTSMCRMNSLTAGIRCSFPGAATTSRSPPCVGHIRVTVPMRAPAASTTSKPTTSS